MDNPGITKEAMGSLTRHPWPGNVRELGNAIQKALIFNRGTPIHTEEIAQAISGENRGTLSDQTTDQVIRKWVREALSGKNEKNLFDSCMDNMASIIISEALALSGGNRSRAAKLLGLSRPTLHSKIEKYSLKIKTSVKKDLS